MRQLWSWVRSEVVFRGCRGMALQRMQNPFWRRRNVGLEHEGLEELYRRRAFLGTAEDNDGLADADYLRVMLMLMVTVMMTMIYNV